MYVSHVSLRPRKRHAFFALVSALAALLAVSASPAGAGSQASTATTAGTFCGAAEASPFNSLAGFTATGTAARGTDQHREPSSSETAIEVPPGAAKGGKSFRATIPVYFHVVHDGRDRESHAEADQRPDQRPELRLRRPRGRLRHRLPLRARRRHAHRQRAVAPPRLRRQVRARDEAARSTRAGARR